MPWRLVCLWSVSEPLGRASLDIPLQQAFGAQIRGKGGKRHNECQRLILKRFCSERGVPIGGALAFCVDNQKNASAFTGEPQAAQGGCAKQLPSQPLPRHGSIRCQTGKPETRHVMSCQSSRHCGRCSLMCNRRWRYCVEAKDAVGHCIIDCTEGLGRILLVALSRKTSQKLVHLRIAAIEGSAIMGFLDRFLVPLRNAHRVSGRAAIAVRSLALGFGGFSSRLRMRR